MITLPLHVYQRYQEFCIKSGVKDSERADYGKWLRYFLDYCEKYSVAGEEAHRNEMFLQKLQQKGQSELKRFQASQAVALYFAMLRGGADSRLPAQAVKAEQSVELPPEDHSGVLPIASSVASKQSFYNVAGYQEKSDSPEWDEAMEKMAAEIKVRHYSRKTLQTYAKWSRSFQRFLKNKSPSELTTEDVKDYLTFLAVKCHVASTTQNQAFLIAG